MMTAGDETCAVNGGMFRRIPMEKSLLHDKDWGTGNPTEKGYNEIRDCFTIFSTNLITNFLFNHFSY